MRLGLSRVPVYYFYSHSFGDAMLPELLRRMVYKPIRAINGYREERVAGVHLLAVGSIFHHAMSGDAIWGTGINPVRQKRLPPGFKVDIRAVRGPLTRAFVVDELGLDCPEIYGDPAQLLPKYFPEFQASPEQEHIVIAQHRDEEFIRSNWSDFSAYNVFLCQHPRMPWRRVVDQILTSRLVVSSSLHALIIAEAYGIAARWWHNADLPSSRTEGRFKYNDYYASTGRSLDDLGNSIEEALEMGGKEPIQGFDSGKLDSAFPYDLFYSCFERATSLLKNRMRTYSQR